MQRPLRGAGLPGFTGAGHLANVGLPTNSRRRTGEQRGASARDPDPGAAAPPAAVRPLALPCGAHGGHRDLIAGPGPGHLLFTGCQGRPRAGPTWDLRGAGRAGSGRQGAEPHLYPAQLVPLGRARAGSIPSVGDGRPPGGKTGSLSRRWGPQLQPPPSPAPQDLGFGPRAAPNSSDPGVLPPHSSLPALLIAQGFKPSGAPPSPISAEEVSYSPRLPRHRAQRLAPRINHQNKDIGRVQALPGSTHTYHHGFSGLRGLRIPSTHR